MVDALQPTARDTVMDPAAGTGGFLLVAHEYASRHAEELTPEERDHHLRDGLCMVSSSSTEPPGWRP
jgi:type I restriction enzyme M protein